MVVRVGRAAERTAGAEHLGQLAVLGHTRIGELCIELDHPEKRRGVTTTDVDVAEIREHSSQDQVAADRRQEMVVKRYERAVDLMEEVAACGRSHGSPPGERVDEHVVVGHVANEEVSWHAHPEQGHARAAPNLDQQHRKGDRDTRAPVDDHVEKRVPRVVVVDGVARETQVAKEQLQQTRQRAVADLGRERIEPGELGGDRQCGLRTRGDHEGAFAEVVVWLGTPNDLGESVSQLHGDHGSGSGARTEVATVAPMVLYAFLDHPGPIAIAHRGGAGVHPENTMEAFSHAVSLGYRYLETDVHLSRDGHVIAFHDERLDRVTDLDGRIDERTLAEIREARISGTGTVVLLDELLATFPRQRVNIDPKSDAVVEPLARLLARAGAVERVCIGSFSDRRIRRARQLLGEALCTSGGPQAIARLRLASMGVPVRMPIMGCVQVPARAGGFNLVDARFVRAAHARGLPVHVWTIDEPIEMHRLLDLGVDGLMSDQPDVLRSVLRERGSWHEA